MTKTVQPFNFGYNAQGMQNTQNLFGAQNLNIPVVPQQAVGPVNLSNVGLPQVSNNALTGMSNQTTFDLFGGNKSNPILDNNNLTSAAINTNTANPSAGNNLFGDLTGGDLFNAGVGLLSSYLNWGLQDERNNIARSKVDLGWAGFNDQVAQRDAIQAANKRANSGV